MPPKPNPAAGPGKSGPGKPPPQVTNTDRFNLNELRTDVSGEIERAIAAAKASELTKYVVFVTGGASGLGKEICKSFIAEGSKVAILDKDKINGPSVAMELCKNHGKSAAMFFYCNLADPKSFEDAAKLAKTQMGRFDILVNNAACFNDSMDHFESSINVNFKSVVYSSLWAVSNLTTKAGGSGGLVINIADSLAFLPAYLTPIYAATKAAVLKFTTDMGHAQLVNLNKVGFLAIVPNAFKESKLYDEPTNKLLFPARDMLDAFNQKFKLSQVQQTPEHVAKNILQIVKTGARSGVFLIENGEPFVKLDLPEVSVKPWFPDKL